MGCAYFRTQSHPNILYAYMNILDAYMLGKEGMTRRERHLLSFLLGSVVNGSEKPQGIYLNVSLDEKR
jgi:hypothetical protein